MRISRNPRLVVGRLFWIVLFVALVTGVGQLRAPADAGDSFRSGDLIRVGRLGIVAPPPGEGGIAFVIHADGSQDRLVVETLSDGTVLINPEVDLEEVAFGGVGESAQVEPGECTDTAGTATGKAWSHIVEWWFKASSTPSYLNLDPTEQTIRDAIVNITHEHNDCGEPDRIDATSNYLGRNSNSADISSSSNCLAHDNVNQVDFGALAGDFGITCMEYSGPAYTEFDMRLNSGDGITWTNGGCGGSTSKHYVEGIATHEFGHVFSAQHPSGSHPALTMGGANSKCPEPDEKSSLGLGDMESLEYWY